uniref:Uncharacterized protein n=1 Tax=Anguilla anguilla TaxID=7936 RepID=A0A0E9Y2B0_ANGAN
MKPVSKVISRIDMVASLSDRYVISIVSLYVSRTFSSVACGSFFSFTSNSKFLHSGSFSSGKLLYIVITKRVPSPVPVAVTVTFTSG